MAVTRLGLHGSASAYLPFVAKSPFIQISPVLDLTVRGARDADLTMRGTRELAAVFRRLPDEEI